MNLKNYLICTFLHSYRQTYPFALMKKHEFFKRFEEEFKEILEGVKKPFTLGVLFENGLMKIDYNLKDFPEDTVRSWILLRGGEFVYAYTKSKFRKQGHASRIMKQILLRKELEGLNEITMKYYTPNGFNFLKSKSWRGASDFNIYVS